MWQLAQLVAAVNVLWSTFAPAQLAVDLWQVSHTVTPACTGVFGLPTAGGNAPVWQVAHDALTLTLLCNRAGSQAVKPLLWQLSHEGIDVGTVVGMWLAVLPVALLPWHDAQVPAATPTWLKRAAGRHAEVRWQLSHDACVTTCPVGLPVARPAPWQVWQVPVATPAWLNLAPAKLCVPWQVSQPSWVGMCWVGLTTLARASLPPAVWQLAQSRGVPLKTPFRWQDSQRCEACVPFNAKPVLRWSKLRAVDCANAPDRPNANNAPTSHRHTSELKAALPRQSVLMGETLHRWARRRGG